MSDEFSLGLGMAHQLEITFRRAGYTLPDIDLLVKNQDFCARFLKVLHGKAEIEDLDHIVDLDAEPFIPEGWTVEEHQKNGLWEWDPQGVRLEMIKPPPGNNCFDGYQFRQTLVNKPVLNVNLFDYLLAHPLLVVPRDWRGKRISAWGTVYRDRYREPSVRSFVWSGAHLIEDTTKWLRGGFGGGGEYVGLLVN